MPHGKEKARKGGDFLELTVKQDLDEIKRKHQQAKKVAIIHIGIRI